MASSGFSFNNKHDEIHYFKYISYELMCFVLRINVSVFFALSLYSCPSCTCVVLLFSVFLHGPEGTLFHFTVFGVEAT